MEKTRIRTYTGETNRAVDEAKALLKQTNRTAETDAGDERIVRPADGKAQAKTWDTSAENNPK